MRWACFRLGAAVLLVLTLALFEQSFAWGRLGGMASMFYILIGLIGLGLAIEGGIRLRRIRTEQAVWDRTIATPERLQEITGRLVERVRAMQAQEGSTPPRRALLAAINEEEIVGKKVRAYLVFRVMRELAPQEGSEPSATASPASTPPAVAAGAAPRMREPRVDAGYGSTLQWVWYALATLAAFSCKASLPPRE